MAGRHLLVCTDNHVHTHTTHTRMNSPKNPKCLLELAVDWAQFIFPGVERCSRFKGRCIAQKAISHWA